MTSIAPQLVSQAQWLNDLVFFHSAEAINFIGILILIVLYHLFDFTTIFNWSKQSLSELYVLGAPLLGILFQVTIVDLLSYLETSLTDPADHDLMRMVYFGAMILNAIVQLSANASSVVFVALGLLGFVLLFSLNALSLVTFQVDLVLAGVIAIILALIVVYPIVLEIVGFTLVIIFDVLGVTAAIDSLILLFENPDRLWSEVKLLTEGQLTPQLQQIEDKFEELLGPLFTFFYGDSILKDIEEDFVLISVAQLLIPLIAIPWTAVKGLITMLQINDAPYDVIEHLNLIDWHSEVWLILNVLLMAKTLLFDGYHISFIIYYLLFEPVLDQIGVPDLKDFVYNSLDYVFLYFATITEIEGDFWVAYLFFKQFAWKQEDSGIVVPSLDDKSIWELSFGDVLSLITLDKFETNSFASIKDRLQPAVILVLLPIVQGASWVFEVPFLAELWWFFR